MFLFLMYLYLQACTSHLTKYFVFNPLKIPAPMSMCCIHNRCIKNSERVSTKTYFNGVHTMWFLKFIKKSIKMMLFQFLYMLRGIFCGCFKFLSIYIAITGLLGHVDWLSIFHIAYCFFSRLNTLIAGLVL